MYDGVPILSKWISVTGGTYVMVSVYSVEFLALNQPWSIGGLETDTITGETDAGKRFVMVENYAAILMRYFVQIKLKNMVTCKVKMHVCVLSI